MAKNEVKKKLGELLIEEGAIDEDQLRSAIVHGQGKGIKLGQALVELDYITEERKLKVLSRQRKVKYLNIGMQELDQDIDKELKDSFESKFIEDNSFIPYKKTDMTFQILVTDTYNTYLVDYLEGEYELPVEHILISDNLLEEWIVKNVNMDFINRELSMIRGDRSSESIFDITGNVDSTAVVATVNNMIKEAADMRASDIHIQPREKTVQIRYRIDGILHNMSEVPIGAHSSIVTRIKTMADMDIAETRIPLDGRLQVKVEDKSIDMRIATIPSAFGEKITMRILDKTAVELKLDSLQLLPDTRAKFEKGMKNPVGVILMTGPTGSGKSTSLYTVINELKSEHNNIMTIEDPVEYKMEDITQTQVNVKANMGFSEGLRSILRHDPDIVLVGEIRDKETGVTALQAANTGHLVLSTLHTNDAPSALPRLIDMGVDAYMISDYLLMVINQRLVRKICSECKEEYLMAPDDIYREEFDIDPEKEIKLYRGRGCRNCLNTGYKGRIPLQELLYIDKDIRELLSKSATTYEIRNKAIENGMRVLKLDGYEKALMGLTTFEEVRRLTNVE